jgi:HD-GYP domain-containing protein (c-di-GMP phosphodiesterase class II)
VTYAKEIKNSQNIIGVDISLNTLSLLLKSEIQVEGTLSYLIDQKNNKLIASNIDKALSQKEIRNIIKKTKNINSTVEHNNIKYFISNTILNSSSNTKNQLIIFTPKDKVMEPYNKKIAYAILLNLFVMALLSPLIFYLTKLVSQPIHALEVENQKIKNRKFDEVVRVDTKIRELSALSSSLVSMSLSIKEYQEAQLKLMDSFIELIAGAIDAKSEYSGGHCNRVPTISISLAKIASEANDGIFKDFKIQNEEELREISIAAWLHDCGKVTTPEYIVDKATKLETIYNRIHEIRMRFEVVYRDLIINYYKELQNGKNKEQLEQTLKIAQEKLINDFNFIATCNIGGEFMDQASKDRIFNIAQTTWTKYFDDSLGLSQDEKLRYKKSNSKLEYILADKNSHIIPRTNFSQEEYDKFNFKVDVPEYQYNLGEIYNLTVDRGTLTKEDRFKINEHIIMSIKMLEALPFPENLKNVPAYAGGHHETLIGTGYPRKLTKEQLSIPARIIALADVFEALTASDRPYKSGKKLSETIKILSFMVKDQHIDKDIFELFLKSGYYKEYAIKHLSQEQIDDVNIENYLS